MEFNEYKKLALRTRKHWDKKDKDLEMAYYTLGLVGEAGEVVEVVKKHLVGSHEINPALIKKELGDVLWYTAAISEYFGFDMNEIAQLNIDKLAARHGDTWSGYGDRSGTGA